MIKTINKEELNQLDFNKVLLISAEPLNKERLFLKHTNTFFNTDCSLYAPLIRTGEIDTVLVSGLQAFINFKTLFQLIESIVRSNDIHILFYLNLGESED